MGSSDDGVSVVERVRRTGGEWRRWFLLDGDRVLIGVGIALLFGAAFGSLRALGLMPLANAQPIYYLFGGLISGNLTLITVVVSINQLLLGRELNSPGELESQIRNVVDYRGNVESSAGRLAPVEPLGFLRLLFENTRREAQRLGGMAAGTTSGTVNDEIEEFVEEITDNVDRLDDLLEPEDPSVFHVLSVTLTTNYARNVHQIRHVRERHADELSEHISDQIDSLIDAIRNIDIARQYFKSIYIQIELSQLSRVLLYAGLPAEAAAGVTLYVLTASSGPAIPSAYVPPFFVAMSAIGFLPLSLLCSFILRITVVTQRTAAIHPFTTPEQER